MNNQYPTSAGLRRVLAIGAAAAVITSSLVVGTAAAPANASAERHAPPPVSRTLVDDAFVYLATDFPKFFANTNQGSAYELRRSESLFTLARAVAAGDPDPAHRDRLIGWVSRTLNETAHMPDMHAGIDMRQQQYYLLALDVIWKTPSLKALLTPAEQTKVRLIAEAAVIADAYVTADYDAAGAKRADNTRITIDGDPNCWPQGNPNWTEAIVGSLLAGSYIVGLDSVGALLNDYSHTAFVAELGAAGLANVQGSFAVTPAATIEGYVRSIDDNEAAGRPFFRNTSLGSLPTDPFGFYYDAVGSYTYRLTATEGPFTGQVGRATEFQSSDAYGVRDGLSYVVHGLNHSLGNRYLLEFEDDWRTKARRDDRRALEKLMTVGFSDVYGKALNGYWAVANGKQSYQSAAEEFYWPQFAGFATDYGLFSPALFTDSFQDGDLAGWSATGSWTVSTEPTWSGSTTASDPVASVSAGAGAPAATLIAPLTGSSYAVRAPLKVVNWTDSSSGFVGVVGKYTDAANYYAAGYDAASGKLQIVRVLNGKTKVLADKRFEWSTGSVHQVYASFTAEGDIVLDVDGVKRLETRDKKLTTGAVGYIATGTDVRFDDLLVTAP